MTSDVFRPTDVHKHMLIEGAAILKNIRDKSFTPEDLDKAEHIFRCTLLRDPKKPPSDGLWTKEHREVDYYKGLCNLGFVLREQGILCTKKSEGRLLPNEAAHVEGDGVKAAERLEEAVEVLLRARSCAGSDDYGATALTNLGAAYYALKRDHKAISAFETVVGLRGTSEGIDPFDPEALRDLADLYYAHGDHRNANELYIRLNDVLTSLLTDNTTKYLSDELEHVKDQLERCERKLREADDKTTHITRSRNPRASEARDFNRKAIRAFSLEEDYEMRLAVIICGPGETLKLDKDLAHFKTLFHDMLKFDVVVSIEKPSQMDLSFLFNVWIPSAVRGVKPKGEPEAFTQKMVFVDSPFTLWTCTPRKPQHVLTVVTVSGHGEIKNTNIDGLNSGFPWLDDLFQRESCFVTEEVGKDGASKTGSFPLSEMLSCARRAKPSNNPQFVRGERHENDDDQGFGWKTLFIFGVCQSGNVKLPLFQDINDNRFPTSSSLKRALMYITSATSGQVLDDEEWVNMLENLTTAGNGGIALNEKRSTCANDLLRHMKLCASKVPDSRPAGLLAKKKKNNLSLPKALCLKNAQEEGFHRLLNSGDLELLSYGLLLHAGEPRVENEAAGGCAGCSITTPARTTK